MLKKLPINQLLPGMKVVKTDTPWEKMPYWKGSFTVKDAEDIVRLYGCCKNVLIESEEPPLPATSTIELKKEPQTKQPKLTEVVSKTEQLKTKISVQFAVKSYHQTLAVLAESFSRIKKGETIDAKAIQSSMKGLMLSSIAQPETLSMICNLKNNTHSLEQKSLDVAVLSLMFGQTLGMNNKQLHQLGMAAVLHDIGMLKVPSDLLEKKGILTFGQRRQIQRHVEHSHYILSHYEALKPLTKIINAHHERYDGKGYPAGLRGNKIPLEARILHIAATFEALTRNRHFSEQQSTTNALSKLYRLRNKAFESSLVEKFIKAIGVYPVGTLVKLNNGYTGLVTQANPLAPSRPSIKLLYNRYNAPMQSANILNLTSKQYAKLQISNTLKTEIMEDSAMTKIRNSLDFNERKAA